MALNKQVIKCTNQEAVIKIWGTDDSETITLNSDILAATQVLSGDEFEVNIVTMAWTGLADSTITIERDGATITNVNAQGSDELDFNGLGFNDNIANYADIDVAITSSAQLYLTVRKVAGYKTTVEYATYGAYDDEEKLGPKNISGTPGPEGLSSLPVPGSGNYNYTLSVDVSEAGTAYPEGYFFDENFPHAPGLYRKTYQGNFSAIPGDPIDVNFCGNNEGWYPQVDAYAGFGGQFLENSNYTLEWQGWFRAPVTGTYNFWLQSDDDAFMWFGQNALDGNITNSNYVVNSSNDTAKTINSIQLTEGMFYPVRIQYGEWGGAEMMQVYWSTTDNETGLAYAGNDDGASGYQVWYYNTDNNGI